MSWTIPVDVMTQNARDHVESWMPAEPNAVRVRYSGGTKGVTGEATARVEDRVDIAVAVFRKRKPKEEQRSGDKFTDEFTAIYVDDLLKVNDLIEWRSLRLEVYEVQAPELDGEVVFRRAMLRKKQL